MVPKPVRGPFAEQINVIGADVPVYRLAVVAIAMLVILLIKPTGLYGSALLKK